MQTTILKAGGITSALQHHANFTIICPVVKISNNSVPLMWANRFDVFYVFPLHHIGLALNFLGNDFTSYSVTATISNHTNPSQTVPTQISFRS